MDATNDLAYTPAPLKIMAALADTCQTLKLKLAGEVKALQDQTPELLREPEFGPNTAVGELLSKLSATTEPQKVEDLAELSDAEAGELRSLESALAANPTKIVLALQTNKAAIEAFQEKLKALNAATQEEQIQELVGLKKALDDAKKAADLASSDLFSDEPLSDVGSDIWRALWDAARGYSEESAYPGQDFPVTGDDARCVLCHQELGPEASKRLGSFEGFIRDESKKREKEAGADIRRSLAKSPSVKFQSPSCFSLSPSFEMKWKIVPLLRFFEVRHFKMHGDFGLLLRDMRSILRATGRKRNMLHPRKLLNFWHSYRIGLQA